VSENRYKVVVARHLSEGPPTSQSNAISIALGAEPAQPIQWEWRCSCGAYGTGPHVEVMLEGKQHQFTHVAIVHVRSQDDQPYGSERRCCNHCGIMLGGESSQPFVDNWTDWRSASNNCRAMERA
jgi:hypothetical protein